MEAGRPVRLGSRAIDILTCLVEQPGETVSKRELLERVWPDTTVVEANLSVHVAALRRALGEGHDGRRFIDNDPGRGYRFIAPVAFEASTGDPEERPSERPNNLPAQLTRLIGRGRQSDELNARLDASRLVTIVGSAGVGKTSLALHIADGRLSDHSDGTWLVDLVSISDPGLVVSTIATTLRIDIQTAEPLTALIDALNDQNILLILDNCEHLVDEVARTVAALLSGARGVRVLTTSRELLRIEGEWSYQLLPLETPPVGTPASVQEILHYPAVQLFAERAAAAATNMFSLSDEEAEDIATICRELDGLPLAIELAAARIEAFSVRGLADRLDDRLRLLSLGQRAVWPKHRNLMAALDWSYELLSPDERRMFRRLSVFSGGFTLEAAQQVAGQEIVDSADIIANLVVKSLVSAETGDGDIRFSLLETTRDFARNKLAEASELDETSLAHAQYFLETLISGQKALGEGFAAAFARELGNIRSALNWCLDTGDKDVATALTLASTPLFFGLGLLTECHNWSRRALAAMPAHYHGTSTEVDIMIAVSASLAFSRGLTQETYETWIRTTELSERIGISGYQLIPLRALWTCEVRLPLLEAGMKSARRYTEVANETGDPEALLTVHWIMGTQLHHMGEAPAAVEAFRSYLAGERDEWRRFFMGTTGYDRHSASLAILGNALWLAGYPEQAIEASNAAISDARATGYALAINEALMWSAYTRWLAGAPEATISAEADEMASNGLKHTLAAHHVLGVGLQGMCAGARGEHARAETMIRRALDGLAAANYGPFVPFLLGELATVLAASGQLETGLEEVENFLRSTPNPDSWCMPELHRRHAELLYAAGDPVAGKMALDRAIGAAHRQKTLGWELRARTTRVELACSQAERTDALAELKAVYDQFTEGHASADLVLARRLLTE